MTPEQFEDYLDRVLKVAIRNNVGLMLKYGGEISPKTVALALIILAGRYAHQSGLVDRNMALRWFTRTYDNDPGFSFQDEEKSS